jgi:hypothetical protein
MFVLNAIIEDGDSSAHWDILTNMGTIKTVLRRQPKRFAAAAAWIPETCALAQRRTGACAIILS